MHGGATAAKHPYRKRFPRLPSRGTHPMQLRALPCSRQSSGLPNLKRSRTVARSVIMRRGKRLLRRQSGSIVHYSLSAIIAAIAFFQSCDWGGLESLLILLLGSAACRASAPSADQIHLLQWA